MEVKRYWRYFKYVIRHKYFVFINGLKMGVPILSLIIHDWDKFTPFMVWAYATTFRSPDGVKQYEPHNGFWLGWRNHQHINKHHWQYWLYIAGHRIQETNAMVMDTGEVFLVFEKSTRSKFSGTIIPMRMPFVHVLEMVADWKGAGQALGFPDTAGWYEQNKLKMILHEDTRAEVERLLEVG